MHTMCGFYHISCPRPDATPENINGFGSGGRLGLINFFSCRINLNCRKESCMTYKTVLTEVRGKVGIVRLNRPEARNAFNQLLLREMFEALEAFDRDDEIHA